MLKKRLIPCLDIKEGRVVKGINFKNLRDAGNPVAQAAFYSMQGADELTFLDIAATQENRDTLFDLVSATADQVFIPLTVGGGVRHQDNVRDLLRAGADKVSINSAAVSRPELISEAAEIFGTQCLVLAIDVKRYRPGQWKIFTHGGKKETDIDAIEWAREMAQRGAGELLVTSMDRDGTGKGFDIELMQKITEAVSIPVIASGGAGGEKDMVEAIIEGRVDAVLAATIFHFRENSIHEIKYAMHEAGIPVRLT